MNIPKNNSPSINVGYVFICIIAVIFSFICHELAHWFTGELLGHKMGMSLNRTYPSGSPEVSLHDAMIISAAGPIFTIAQAITCYILLLYKDGKSLYPFLFTAFYMRSLALVISLFNPNDEARISRDLRIGTFTLPLIVAAFLFYLIYDLSRKKGWSLKFNLQTLGLIMLFSSILILSDQFFKIRIM